MEAWLFTLIFGGAPMVWYSEASSSQYDYKAVSKIKSKYNVKTVKISKLRVTFDSVSKVILQLLWLFFNVFALVTLLRFVIGYKKNLLNLNQSDK